MWQIRWWSLKIGVNLKFHLLRMSQLTNFNRWHKFPLHKTVMICEFNNKLKFITCIVKEKGARSANFLVIIRYEHKIVITAVSEFLNFFLWKLHENERQAINAWNSWVMENKVSRILRRESKKHLSANRHPIWIEQRRPKWAIPSEHRQEINLQVGPCGLAVSGSKFRNDTMASAHIQLASQRLKK